METIDKPKYMVGRWFINTNGSHDFSVNYTDNLALAREWCASFKKDKATSRVTITLTPKNIYDWVRASEVEATNGND